MLPAPLPSPAAADISDWAIAVAVPRTASIDPPTSPSTILFASTGINRIQTENRTLATARRTS
jgi:hypothetical protein